MIDLSNAEEARGVAAAIAIILGIILAVIEHC